MRFVRVLALIVVFGFSLTLLRAQTRTPKTLSALFEGLKSPDLEVKNRAAGDLLSYVAVWVQQDPSTMQEDLPALLAALEDRHPEVRTQSSTFFRTVAFMRPKDKEEILRPVIYFLIGRFDDPDPRVRTNLMRAIAALEPAPPYQAIEGFTNHLEDPSPEAQSLAVYGLVRAAPDSLQAAEAVAGLLDNTSDPEARRGLIQMLGAAKSTHPIIIGKLIEQLDSKDGGLRGDTVRALGEIGPPAAQAIQQLRAIASDRRASSILRHPAWEFTDFLPVSLRRERAC